MPRIPRASAMPEYSLPTQAPNPISGGNLNITPDRGAEIQAKQLQGLGDALADTGNTLMRRQTQLNLEENEYRLKIGKQAAEDFFGKKEAEYQEKQGMDVWGLSDKAAREYQEGEAQFESLFTNERQRQDFKILYDGMKGDSLRRVSGYEAKTRKSVQDETDKSGIAIETSKAAANAFDPLTVGDSREAVMAYVASNADRNGFSPQQREQEYLGAMTTFHTQVVQSLLDTDSRRAEAYFKSAVEANEIDGQKQAEIRAKIEAAIGDDIVYGLADQLSAQGAPLTSAREALDRKVTSGDLTPKQANAVMGELKTREQETKYAISESERIAGDQIYRLLSEGTPMTQVPRSVINRADPKVVYALREKDKAERTGASVKTDNATWLSINNQLTDDPNAFAKTNLLQYSDKLSQSDLQSFAAAQNKIKTGEIPDAVTWEQQLNVYLADLKLLGAENANKAVPFMRAAQQALTQAQNAKGKPLTAEERKSVIDPLVTEGEIPGFWNDREGRVYELRGDAGFGAFKAGDGDVLSAQITPEERIQIIRAYKKARGGRMPSEAEILERYRKGMGL